MDGDKKGFPMPKVHLLSGRQVQFQDWHRLAMDEVHLHTKMQSGVYVLGVQLNPSAKPLIVYVGVALQLQERLLHYCSLARRGHPSTDPRPIVQVLRRVPADLWFFTYSTCDNPRELEAELIIGAILYWPKALLVNVQGNAIASGHGPLYLVGRLIERVEEAVGPLPKVDPEPDVPGSPQPWDLAGMSRATWSRCRKATTLHRLGHSQEEIAKALRVDHTTVDRWLDLWADLEAGGRGGVSDMLTGTRVQTAHGIGTVEGRKGSNYIVRLDKPRPNRPVEYIPSDAVTKLGDRDPEASQPSSGSMKQ